MHNVMAMTGTGGSVVLSAGRPKPFREGVYETDGVTIAVTTVRPGSLHMRSSRG